MESSKNLTERDGLKSGDESHLSDEENGSDILFQTSDSRKQIGLTSAIFLIFNRMIGTGIFATPSTIFALSGSVGLTLFIWVAGMLIALAGMMVYLEFGTGLPRNGGEKNYLEFVYRRPRFLVTGMYASYAVLLGWAGSNSVVFGEYILHAADVEVTRWNQRGVGIACVTSAFLIHGLALKWGLRLQNFLGVVKLLILLLIVFSGFAALGGKLKIEKPNNFDNAFANTTGSAYGVVTALYNVIWSYIGYTNANYAMSEMKNPVRTLKIAGPASIAIVGVLYMLANIAYFAAVPKEEILSSGRILAASFFRNVYGKKAERALSVFVALSAYGNVLSVIFSQGRLIQELGREGILPFSKVWASNKPFNAPFAGLFVHWLVSVITMIAPPPGDAYNFSKPFSTTFVSEYTTNPASPQCDLVPPQHHQPLRIHRSPHPLLAPVPPLFLAALASHQLLEATCARRRRRHGLLPPLQRLPHRRALRSPHRRPKRLREPAVLPALRGWLGHLWRWRRVLAVLGQDPTQDRRVYAGTTCRA